MNRKNIKVADEFSIVVGRVLRRHRINNDLTQDQLIDKINNTITRQTLSNYEKGKSEIRHDTFEDICYALGIPPATMFEEISTEYMKQCLSSKKGL